MGKVQEYAENSIDFVALLEISESDKVSLAKGIAAMTLAHERITGELMKALVDLEAAIPNDGKWDYAAAMDNARRVIKKYTEPTTKQLAYEEYVNQCGTQPHVSFEVWEKHYDDGTEWMLDEEKAIRNGNREPNYERPGH